MKIAIFTPKIYRPAFEDAVSRLNRRDRFFCLEYSDFHEICTHYEQIGKNIDGILFSGSLSENYFHSRYPSARIPVCSVRHSRLLTALALLRFSNENTQIPLTKVFCDGIANVTDQKLYSEYLGPELMPRSLTTWHYTDHMLEDLAEEIIHLYRSGEICHGFFTISSLYERVAAERFSCTHISLLPENIAEGLTRILSLTEQHNEMKSVALSMILHYTGEGDTDYNEAEYREATLKKILVDYKKENRLSDLSIDASNGRLELSISAACEMEEPYYPLLRCFQAVRECYSFDLLAGIGVGKHFQEAHSSALEALSHAREFSASCCFCLREGTLTGPLLTDYCLTVHTNLLSLSANIAAELSISPINYVRTITILEQFQKSALSSSPVTSELLARYLNVTVRSANRILTALAKKKIIHETATLPPASGKGRPLRCYELATSALI